MFNNPFDPVRNELVNWKTEQFLGCSNNKDIDGKDDKGHRVK